MNNKPIALVLAGGSGKRWWPLSSYKALFPFYGQPVVSYILEKLPLAGITEAVVVANPNDAKAMSELNISGIKTTVVIQKEPNGMSGAVLSAKEAIASNPTLIINAEDIVEDKLYELLNPEIQKNKPFIVGRKISSYYSTGYLKFAGDRLEAIIEKPGEGNEPSEYTNLVFHYLPKPELFVQEIQRTSNTGDDVYEQALSKLIKTLGFGVVRYEGFWASLKYPWHVLDLLEWLLANLKAARGKKVVIKENVVIEGPVWVGENVKIFENTKIVGPCYIGDNTIIGNNNMIRESHIGANCVTGFNTDITRSYVGNNCWFHSNYVGDSVLEGNISLGSGTVLANFRLDEGDIFSVVKGERLNTKRNKLGAIVAKIVRVGVNSSIMPGVKIGTNSFIGAGLTVDQDIPESTFCYGKTELIIKKNERGIAEGARDSFRKMI